jgi:hypothetical protein
VAIPRSEGKTGTFQPATGGRGSRPVSRVLSGAQEAYLSSPGAIIHLGCTSPHTSSDLPGDSRGPRFAILRRDGSPPYLVLLRVGFTVPPALAGAVRSYRTFSPLPPRASGGWRFVFCGTFRGLAPPRHYLAPCPVEPGLSSAPKQHDTAIARPAPDRVVSIAGRQVARAGLFQHGVFRAALELRARGLGKTVLRELAREPQVAATETLPEVCPNDRAPLGRHCRLLQTREKVALGFVEGLNIKIRVLQRRAYGLRDEEHLRLKRLTCMLPPL